MKYSFVLLFVLIIFQNISPVSAQTNNRDKGIIVEDKNAFWEKVETSVDSFKNKKEDSKKSFKMEFENYNLPNSDSEFTKHWHNEPVPQANTNTCWSFSTTSFYESEIYRLRNIEVKLSEMWTVYWEFVEKARGFVQSRGEWLFTDGSESNAVSRIWEKYGVVPAEVYTGLLAGQTYLSTMDMFDEMEAYLNFVKENNLWNEEEVIATIQSIMNHWIGAPPETFKFEGDNISPKDYLNNYLKLNLSDYVEVMSLMQEPYYEYVEYKVPDNWWHNKDYFNIPLNDFMSVIKKGIRDGYTTCIGGDVSESGKNSDLDVFIVPTYDIPSEYIDENARQFRFSNETTTDDHGIHMVGFLEQDGKDWYLIKDSGSSSRNGNLNGYYIFSEDYVKLKMLGFTIHKDLMNDLIVK
jgi:bleomycin hydrolase